MNAPGRIGLIAGGGDLPVRLHGYAQHAGKRPFVLGIKGFASEHWVEAQDGEMVSIGEIGRQIDLLRKAQCTELVIAGIVKRPDFSSLQVDLKGAAVLPKLVAAAVQGDDALLRASIAVFEQAGFKVIGADDLYEGLLSRSGAYTSEQPSDRDHEDIAIALKVVRRLGELDVGQGAIVRDGVVIAVEAQEGTDAMLDRCRSLTEPHQRGRGVLVKAPKPIQERRIDLPTLGLSTIENVHRAGLVGVAFEEKGALLLDEAEMVRRANELGLFMFGIAGDARS